MKPLLKDKKNHKFKKKTDYKKQHIPKALREQCWIIILVRNLNISATLNGVRIKLMFLIIMLVIIYQNQKVVRRV